MALKIRLARGGSKKRPYYRIVIADIRMPRDGRFIEKVGSWNPMLDKDDEKRVVLEVERIKYWLSVGAQPTDRVLRFLDAADILKREARNNPDKAKWGKKRVEREEEKKATAAAAAEAAKAEAEKPEAEETSKRVNLFGNKRQREIWRVKAIMPQKIMPWHHHRRSWYSWRGGDQKLYARSAGYKILRRLER